MGGGDVKVLGAWFSPYVIRVQVALNLKGVEYEFVEENIVRDKSELLLKSNPVYKKIPVLIHDGKPICESLIIVQYVDEFWANSGPSILPSDPYERAIARFWAFYIDDKWFPSVFGILKAKTKEEEAETIEKAFAGALLLEEAYDKCSKGKRFFGGDSIGYLDIAFGALLGWIETVKELAGVQILDTTNTPKLVSWAKSFRSTEEVKEVLMGTEKFVEFGKRLQLIWKGQSTN